MLKATLEHVSSLGMQHMNTFRNMRRLMLKLHQLNFTLPVYSPLRDIFKRDEISILGGGELSRFLVVIFPLFP
uniref:Uncharacterized protein n=1 Tax=Manihot esculenta TaxID=3983 RepID=A0A2C9UB13_MANES